MQIDVTGPVIGYDGEPLTIPPGPGKDAGEQMILKKAICDSLMGAFRDEEKVSGEEKVKRFDLARKVHKCLGEFEFTMGDLDLVKKMVAKMYTTAVSGAVWDMLAEESKPVEAVAAQ